MSTNKIEELRASVQALQTEIQELDELETLDETQEARFGEALSEIEDRQGELAAAEARAAKVAEIREIEISTPEAVVRGDAPQGPTLIVRNDRDPFELREMSPDLDVYGRGSELRNRAHDVIESHLPEYVSDDVRSEMARKVDLEERGGIAEHVIAHSKPGYTEAFTEYMRTGEMNPEWRATLTTGASSGGVLLPTHLDPSIILTNTGTTNPIRQIARVESTSFHAFNVVTSAGITAEWLSETVEAGDKTPTVSGVTITPAKAAAYVEISREEVQDSDVVQQLPPLFQDAKDRLESDAFINGTGSTAQPYGVVNVLSGVTASRVAAQTNASFGAVDIFALVNSLPARYQNDCSWVGHWFTANLIRQFGGANQPNFWVELGPGIPSQLLGRPFYKSSQVLNAASTTGLSTATASNDNILVLGDFSQYAIVDRIGMEVLFEPLVKGSTRRPTGSVGYVAFWRTGANVVNNDGFRLLQV